MNEQSNVDVVLGIYDAFSRGDIAAILNRLDPQADLQFEGPSAIPWAGNRRGRDGWTTFFQTVGDNLDEITLAMEPFAAQGDSVVASGRYQARVKRTGKRIEFAAGAPLDPSQRHGREVPGADRHRCRSGRLYGGSGSGGLT